MRLLGFIADFLMKNIYISLGLVFFIFVAGVPLWYGFGETIPDERYLNRASGELIVEKAVKNRKDGIRMESGEEIYFDCGGGGGCLSSKQRQSYAGLKAEVWWYEVKNHIFNLRQRYLVRVVVEEGEIISREYSVARFNKWRDSGVVLFVGGLVFIFFIVRAFPDRK